MKTLMVIIGIIMLSLSGLLGWLANDYFDKPSVDEEIKIGSVIQASEYHSTTTRYDIGQATSPIVIKTGVGALGSLILPVASGGAIDLFDATTTNMTGTGREATSSLYLASFPTGATAGVYTFDEVFFNGLMLVFTTKSTSTITYR